MFNTIYKHIRLFVLRHKEPYRIFYGKLGFCPNNIDLFKLACRHRSVHHDDHKGHNERLEFLGDAVLSTVVSDIVYHTFTTHNEGFLSKTRSKIVKRETLNEVAHKIGLDKVVEVHTSSQSHNNNTFGNALEALIGAIYLDQGYERCCEIVASRIILPHIDIKKISQQEVNFKSRFIEWCQHYRLPYLFDTDSSGLDEYKNPLFYARLFIDTILMGEGRGYTKKEAQQKAAQDALQRIKKQKNSAQILQEKIARQETVLISTDEIVE